MRKITILLLLLLLAIPLAQATELYDKLLKLKNVRSVEQLDKGTFAERYVVMMEQPLDHKNPKKGSFEQRFVVAHSGFDRPTLLVTEGYGGARALGKYYREEISSKLNTNQVFVEHRFFGASTPSPRNWAYLNGENAAADLHVIRKALSSLYPQKWVASGISKGGQNTMIYATFYPNDVDAYVPYVGPVCFGVEDGRHEPFLEKVGTDSERKIVFDFQTELLNRREELMPLFTEFCNGKGYKFKIPIDEVFDYCVLEYPFALWQWGTALSTIPQTDAPHQELVDNLVMAVDPIYFTVTDEPSFFVQAARELGYYGYDTKPFQGLLAIDNAKGYLHRLFLPKDAMKIKFTPTLANKIMDYLKNNDPKMIFIYGENDPWSAAMPDVNVFEGKKNMMLMVEPRGSHKTRIETLPEPLKAKAWDTLAEWLK